MVLILKGRAFDGKVSYRDAALKIDSEKGTILEFGERGSIEEPRSAKKIELEDAVGSFDRTRHESALQLMRSMFPVRKTEDVVQSLGNLR